MAPAGEGEDPVTEETAGQGLIGVDTVAAVQERRKFRRTVGRADTAFLMLAAIIVLDTLGAVSSYGAQAFTWLIVMVIFFLVPYGLLTAELGTAFPEEAARMSGSSSPSAGPRRRWWRSCTGWTTRSGWPGHWR